MKQTLTLSFFGLLVAALLLAMTLTAAPAEAESCWDPKWDYPNCCPDGECPPGFDPDDRRPGICLPYPQPQIKGSFVKTDCEGQTCESTVDTGEGIFPPCDPFNYATFPGTNFLPNVWQNLRDIHGNEMANTLPSDPETPYRLHPDPEVSLINPRSPTDDLNDIFDGIQDMAQQILDLWIEQGEGHDETYDDNEAAFLAERIPQYIRVGLDILEGMPVPNRVYSGIPLLHYVGPEKVAEPTLTYDNAGNLVAANVDVHQIWYDQHVESDVAYIDTTDILECNPLDEEKPCEWTVTYHIDVLTDGHDDFSPFAIFFDRNMASGEKPLPHAGMDQTFFDMQEGTRSVFKMKMPPAGYMNLIYTWGWRQHPPRIQAIENARKKIAYSKAPDGGVGSGGPHKRCPSQYNGKTLPEVEQMVFCRSGSCDQVRCKPGQPRWDENGNPTECEQDMLYAIGKLGDIAPAKRMWNDLRKALVLSEQGEYQQLVDLIGSKSSPASGIWAAFFAWKDRTKLPCYEWDRDSHCIDGVNPDPDSDITILYANNTIYGQLTQVFDGYTDYSDPENPQPIEQVIRAGWVRWDEWKLRPQELKVTALNGDHFVHSYLNVDFGGGRGWENLFKSSVRVAGSGCWFTFGRASWHINTAPAWICVPEATDDGEIGEHKVGITYNYEPSRRLRFYQFDQFHHDVNIYSIH